MFLYVVFLRCNHIYWMQKCMHTYFNLHIQYWCLSIVTIPIITHGITLVLLIPIDNYAIYWYIDRSTWFTDKDNYLRPLYVITVHSPMCSKSISIYS